MTSKRTTYGFDGQERAERFLIDQGYTIIDRNYYCQAGEIDLIAQHDDTLAFIEVKTRKNPLFDPSSVITASKQRKITTTARLFLATRSIKNCYHYRFDVLLVSDINNTIHIDHIINAFSPLE